MELKRAKVIILPTKDKIPAIWLRDDDYLINNETPMSKWWDAIGMHLYITTNDEIKEGDWFYSTFNDNQPKIQQRKGNYTTSFNEHKIIATTDGSLRIKTGGFPKITNVPNIIKPLPQPSQVFIEKYCKVGGIDEVNVEYINTIKDTFTEVDFSDKNPVIYNQSTTELIEPILKVNNHNTITIHPIKDSWTREEVIALFMKYNEDKRVNIKWFLDNNL